MNINELPEQAQTPVLLLGKTLSEHLGEDLLSLTLVGSVLTADYHPRRSDINSVLVVRQNTPELLDFLAAVGPKMGRRGVSAPLLMWPAYIERSCDVFAVEWLDYQWRNRTVLGSDPFAGLTFDKRDVRLQCEREYKSALVRLRQGYIRSLGKSGVIADLLASAARELIPYLRATLWLAGSERPAATDRLFEQLCKTANVCLSDLAERYAGRYERRPQSPDTMRTAFDRVCRAIEGLADYVDTLEV